MKLTNNTRLIPFLCLGFALLTTGGCQKDKEDDGPTFKIGQFYGGGYIFYIDDSGEHGFICAPSDQSAGIVWWNGSNTITNATGSDYGTGKTNTDLIITAQGPGNYAAQICKDLVLNGYSDWFLPSKSECFEMYFKLKLMNDIGNFADELYWSSTEASAGNAYSQYGNDGYPPNGGYYKNTPHRVRAIRAF